MHSLYTVKDPYIENRCKQCCIWKYNNTSWCDVCCEYKSFVMINFCPKSKMWEEINSEYLELKQNGIKYD